MGSGVESTGGDGDGDLDERRINRLVLSVSRGEHVEVPTEVMLAEASIQGTMSSGLALGMIIPVCA